MTQSFGWGTVEKNDTLASQPELKSSASGEWKNVAKRFSSEACQVVDPDSSLEPVEPNTAGEDSKREMRPCRAALDVVIER